MLRSKAKAASSPRSLAVAVLAAALLFASQPLHGSAAPATAAARQPADCTITGTDGDDILDGTNGADVICGLGGNDVINGRDGADVIEAGAGDDDIKGGLGDDTLSGDLGSDTCRQNKGKGETNSCEWPSPIRTCPVAEGTVYNDFGDPRGDHTHQGNDITAQKGEPVLAAFPGTTTNKNASGAGRYVTLTRGDGSFAYGMHLLKYAEEGEYQAGEVIGYVGSSGNAGSINHLHFEWHPDGGDAVDPFPYLSKVCPDTSG